MNMMRLPLVAFIATLLAAPAVPAGASSGRTNRIEGEIIEIRQSVATENQGSFTEIRVRTRQQQEAWLRLGLSEEMGNRFQVRDRIRARVGDGGQGDPLSVRSIKNYRTRERLRIRDEDGTLLRDRDRTRGGDRLGGGSGGGDRGRDRDRVRTHDGAHQHGGRGDHGAGAGHRGNQGRH